jgi:hypothetical protein
MQRMKSPGVLTLTVIILLAIILVSSNKAYAHCDTLDGPVVKTAKTALQNGNITPVLKWVKEENEAEIKDLFKKTLIVRAKGKEAQELADMYFLETLVRLHRAGEGVPYTGLKPAGVVEPAVVEADKALESGSAENLIKLVTEAAAKGILERFNKAKAAKKHADQNVDAGREFVEAYVQFTHYVEKLHLDAVGPTGHRHGEPKSSLHDEH